MKIANPDREHFQLGVVQGRLIQSPPGQLQWFPQNDWQSEFYLAAACGFNFIELIAERSHNPINPIWSNEGTTRIKELVNQNNLSLHALCDDYIIDHALLNNEAVLEQIFQLIDRGVDLGCTKIVLPLFEKSEINTDNIIHFIDPLRAIADKAASGGMTVCLETILTGSELLELLERVNHSSIGIVYDTGNRVAFGHDIPADIRLLGECISHVHIKDKDQENQNVLLGTGLVNFYEVFKALIDIPYEGPFTLETTRGKDAIRTARYHVDFVHYFYGESSE